MSYLDALLRKVLRINGGTPLVERKTWNFVSGATAVDNPTTGETDITFATSSLLTLPQINDTSSDHQYVFAVSELAADRTVTLPLLIGADTFVFESHIQTLTNKTLTSPVLTTPQINDTSSDHQYVFAVSELAADRTVKLPLLIGADTFVFESHIQTLTGKTLAEPIINGQKQGVTVAVSAMAIDWSLGCVFTKTLAAGANTFTFSNHASGQCIIVRVTGAASTLTWPTVKWAGGVAPTQTASGIDVYTFVNDGTSVYGSVVQAMT